MFKRLLNQRGASQTEYALLLSLIAMFVIPGVTLIGQETSQLFSPEFQMALAGGSDSPNFTGGGNGPVGASDNGDGPLNSLNEGGGSKGTCYQGEDGCQSGEDEQQGAEQTGAGEAQPE